MMELRFLKSMKYIVQNKRFVYEFHKDYKQKDYRQIIMHSHPFGNQGYSDQQGDNFQYHTSLAKTIILESNCHPSHQYSVNIPYNFQTRQLDLGQTLHEIFQQIIPYGHQYQVFYYCHQSQYYVFGGMYPFQQYLYLDQYFVGQPVISVKITRIHPPPTPIQTETINKKKRVNDRNISEVLQKVAEWRKIREDRGITLEEAAKEIDLPKKTLDDYFYQIKQGEAYGFKFEENKHERIGVLRKFVKQKHKKKEEKPIKILEQFMQIAGDLLEDKQQEEEEDEQYSQEQE